MSIKRLLDAVERGGDIGRRIAALVLPISNRPRVTSSSAGKVGLRQPGEHTSSPNLASRDNVAHKPASQYPSANFVRNSFIWAMVNTSQEVLRRLLVAVQPRQAVVAFPQGSKCPRQALQTCRLILETCPSSIGVLPG
jgi:hypothetical protein